MNLLHLKTNEGKRKYVQATLLETSRKKLKLYCTIHDVPMHEILDQLIEEHCKVPSVIQNYKK